MGLEFAVLCFMELFGVMLWCRVRKDWVLERLG